jgi:hypothetical protein
MDAQVVKQDISPIEAAIMGDLSRLTALQRVNYYQAICKSIDVNPLTRPFDYIVLNGKLTLYARKDCTEQLRASRRVSITKLERETISGVYVVTAYAQAQDGRTDSSTGAVAIEGLKGNALANAIMKAETKAKRRVTLSIVGLGWLDETETETIIDARPVVVAETGEIVQPAQIAAPKGNGGGTAHWSASLQTRKAFWAETNRRGLTNDQVHLVLGHDHLAQYTGTYAEALALIDAWINARTETETIIDARPVVVAETGEIVQPAQIAAPKGNGGGTAHWSASLQTRKAFWAETNRRGLTNDQVHLVLGHDHLAQYTGTYAEALALIDAWINARTETAQVDALNVAQRTTEIPF